MLDKAKELLARYISYGSKITVAVSGGKDSMCLLSLVISGGFTNKNNISAVHIHHGIRGGSADRDSEFVGRFCSDNGIGFILEKVDVPALSRESGKSIETQARDSRRATFEKLLKDGKADKLLLAHHAGDQAETILMHIFRGSGLRGLAGMEIDKGGVLRPLLTSAKQEIDAFIEKEKIPFIDDETNALCDYNRNYVRNVLLPGIRERWPGVEAALINLSTAAREGEEYISSTMDENNIKYDSSRSAVSISLACLGEKQPYAQYIFRALNMLGVYQDIGQKNIAEIRELTAKRNGAALDLPGGISAIKEYDNITIYRSLALKPRLEESFGLGKFLFGSRIVSIEAGIAQKSNGRLMFDLEKIPDGCVLRARREGDIFEPFGGGTKKFKKYLIDKKIPKRRREEIPCVCSGNEVLIAAGLEISNKIKIDKKTKKPASVTIENIEE